MIAPPATPPPALAAAVRAGNWSDVRTVAATLPAPLAPEVALVVAAAERDAGRLLKADQVLVAALRHAGPLADAIRLALAEVRVARGRDPWEVIEPLFRRSTPAARRRAATEVLRSSWESLPLPVLRHARHHRLSPSLRRELDAVLAVRTGDRSLARKILRAATVDQPALVVARWLAGQPGLSLDERLDAASALIARGWWREGEDLLAADAPSPTAEQRFRTAFLRARAAYRLERWTDAAVGFSLALDEAPTDPDRFAAAVQRARVAEILGDLDGAIGTWRVACRAAPREVEGWDGLGRDLAASGRTDEAIATFFATPRRVRTTSGPRLAAMLLAHGAFGSAERVLSALAPDVSLRGVLETISGLHGGEVAASRRRLATLLADPRAAAWRDLLVPLSSPVADEPPAAMPTTDPATLAGIAADRGVIPARDAFAAALARDPLWAPLMETRSLPDPGLAEPVRALIAVGLDALAARLYADEFPSATPSELAWSASRLAVWGNGPAALADGEHLWDELGRPPALLLPDVIAARVFPQELSGRCAEAAGRAGVPTAWLAAVVRQESRFAVRARSTAGALGIAQLVPETARRLGAEPDDALDPEQGLRLAALELARLRRLYGDHLAVVAAAYNAGPAITTTWLNLLGDDAGDALFAAAIPYGETARYVLAVSEGAALARSAGQR